MHFSGQQTLNLPQARAWQLLIDPQQVSKCVPGLKSLSVVDAAHFNAEVGVGVGSFTATFTMNIEWLEFEPPHRARMKIHGSAPGSVVDGESEMKLGAADASTTILDWTADVNIGGMLAAVGNRLIAAVTQKLAAKFFECVKEKMEGTV